MESFVKRERDWRGLELLRFEDRVIQLDAIEVGPQ